VEKTPSMIVSRIFCAAPAEPAAPLPPSGVMIDPTKDPTVLPSTSAATVAAGPNPEELAIVEAMICPTSPPRMGAPAFATLLATCVRTDGWGGGAAEAGCGAMACAAGVGAFGVRPKILPGPHQFAYLGPGGAFGAGGGANGNWATTASNAS
jgi:hypothetical protein